MGNFLTSPREAAATSMYDQAMQGHTPWDAMIGQRFQAQKTGLEQYGSRLMGQSGLDTTSQLASAGIAPGSAAAIDTIGKTKAGIADKVLQGEQQLTSDAIQTQLQALSQFLNTGYEGLSKSSTLGDIFAGLQTITNIGTGVALGGGPQGLNIWKKKSVV